MSGENSQNSCTIFQQLFRVIEQRRCEMPPDSYTTAFFQTGIGKIAAKINKESQELIDAAMVTTHATNLQGSKTNYHYINDNKRKIACCIRGGGFSVSSFCAAGSL